MTGGSRLGRTLVFDVNETLLDLRALDPLFERICGDGSVRRQWFALVLRTALSLTLIGRYRDLSAIGAGSLRMIGEQRGIPIADGDVAAVLTAMANLPAHHDVAPSLERLTRAGFRLAALTNSPQEVAEQQLMGAGIAMHFRRIMSVAPTAMFKPAPAVYRMAATELQHEPAELTMVAAHDWDVAGAMAVGYRGAFVVRPDTVRNPLFVEPDITGPDLSVVTDRIIEGGRPLREKPEDGPRAPGLCED